MTDTTRKVYTASELEQVQMCDSASSWCRECKTIREVVKQAAAQARVIEKLKAGLDLAVRQQPKVKDAHMRGTWDTYEFVRAELNRLLTEEGLLP